MSETVSKPNQADFIVNEKKGEYDVVLYFSGTVHATIHAADDAEAKRKADELLAEYEDGGAEIDDLDEARVDRCRPARPMYLITRNGGPMQTSHLEPGDTPRQPTSTGF